MASTEFESHMKAVYRDCHPPSASCLAAQTDQDQFVTELVRQMPGIPPEAIRAVVMGAVSKMQCGHCGRAELGDGPGPGDGLLLDALCKAERAWRRQQPTSRRLTAQAAQDPRNASMQHVMISEAWPPDLTAGSLTSGLYSSALRTKLAGKIPSHFRAKAPMSCNMYGAPSAQRPKETGSLSKTWPHPVRLCDIS